METGKIRSSPGREIETSVFDRAGTVLLESISMDDDSPVSWLFKDPADVIQCYTGNMVSASIDRIESAASKGLYAAGFISYEAGAAWDPHCREVISEDFPLLWFGLYDSVQRFEGPPVLPAPLYPYEPIEHFLNVSSGEYEDRVRTILRHIRDGDTYQVNYTARTNFQWRHGALQLYLRLRRSQPVPYGALINCGDFTVVSLSPELFLAKRGDELWTRPMKGTAPRGTDRVSDEKIAKWLRTDTKNRAENLMIVDLMRNDLGQVGEPGTVHVFDPFRIEPYSGLFQMTSGVRCTLREGVRLSEILKATFPPGSITGAPKVNTMKIIAGLEDTPRKVYTGAIGTVDPEGGLTMSVAIRTVICTDSGKCEMGVGSGIVSDSDPVDEFRETALKADFLNFLPSNRIDLFETILIQPDGTLLWFEEHLDRMQESAAHLDFHFSREQARTRVERSLNRIAAAPAILRLSLTRTGDMTVEILPFSKIDGSKYARIIVGRHQADPADALVYHKTTNRKAYDLELAEAVKQGFFEVLFTSIGGDLTEGAFTNLFILTDSGWVTPDLNCGLLPGIWRKKHMELTGAAEACIKVNDLAKASRVVVGNSVRGSIEVNEIVDAAGAVIFQAASSTKS